jgi:hypothetical protein
MKGIQVSDNNVRYDYLFVIPIGRGSNLRIRNISEFWHFYFNFFSKY